MISRHILDCVTIDNITSFYDYCKKGNELMFGTYQRLQVNVNDSNITVIRLASLKLRKHVRHARMHRTARHAFYREMLQYHFEARKLVKEFSL